MQKDLVLDFARQLTGIINKEWQSGAMLDRVSPITRDLLKFWFYEAFCDERCINFHKGQRQAILNTIYCHEVLRADSTLSIYQSMSDKLSGNFITPDFLNHIKEDKYKHPKYCIKMATGTGKTWVLNALLVWQYLNAKFGDEIAEVKFSKNFLIVAPGLIVYERLLDAFLGKERGESKGGFVRDFATCDMKSNEKLFVPEKYRNAIFGFIQNSVVRKEDIGRKITGDGCIAITNWHLLKEIETGQTSPLKDPSRIVKELLPITPGVSAGHDLNTLDNRILRGGELEYLRSLGDICVFNDEAHHIHENKTNGLVNEVEWQKSLNFISKDRGRNFIQIDFSATPYNVVGSKAQMKHYFPHIIVDFTLKEAITSGLVKTIAIDKRKEFGSIENEELNFKAIREGNEVIDLSDGQRLMLRAALSKLGLLEREFTKANPHKHPKMLIICEDTKVSPLVVNFLLQEGLNSDDIMQIDSNKQGEVKESEWKQIKQRLFNIDKVASPKVIVSVLMLREGFDVSNVCVIVPLRSSKAPILLEQVIGRGLRLMWRERDYDEIKEENRYKMFREKQAPSNYLDILSIIEHPAFIQFYDDLDSIEVVNELEIPQNILGDIITVGLKEDYQRYDFYIPKILQEGEEILSDIELDSSTLHRFPWNLAKLKEMVRHANGEVFYSQELTTETRFGNYKVNADLINASSYNDFLAKILNTITSNITKIAGHSSFPTMQINQSALIKIIDEYIKNRLFGERFDPQEGNNYKVLLIAKSGIIEHICKEISQIVYAMQNSTKTTEAVITK